MAGLFSNNARRATEAPIQQREQQQYSRERQPKYKFRHLVMKILNEHLDFDIVHKAQLEYYYLAILINFKNYYSSSERFSKEELEEYVLDYLKMKRII